jgi:hypothetical protein
MEFLLLNMKELDLQQIWLTSCLNLDKTKTLECKLVELRFNLEYYITATKEDEEESTLAALTTQGLQLQLQDLHEQVTVKL